MVTRLFSLENLQLAAQSDSHRCVHCVGTWLDLFYLTVGVSPLVNFVVSWARRG
jgi:hypothetical protein